MGSELFVPPNLSRRIFPQPPPVPNRRRSPPNNVAGSAMRGDPTLKRAVLSASPIAAARLLDLRSLCAKTLEIGEEARERNRMDLNNSTKESETKKEAEEERGSERSSPPPPPPPEQPLPGDCCGSGCVRCVWDVYYEELEDYNKVYKK